MNYFRKNIERMAGYVAGEQSAAGKVIKLNTNENPYPPSPAVGQAIRAALEQGLSRYPDATGTAFRLCAADLLGVEPDWILCGNGSDDILTILTRALVGQGQRLRMPTPSYILYKTLADIQDADTEQIPFNTDWSLPDAFSKPDERVRFAVVPNPNSPSGTMIPPADLLRIAERLDCPLLVDEAYADFAEENCIDLVRENEKIMVSRTLSKSYSLAGLRFGYLVAQPQIIQQCHKVRDSYNCDTLSIAGATAAINDQAWRADNREKIIATRARLTEQLIELGFQVIPSQANFVWATHPQRSHQELYEGLKGQNILVRYMNYPDWGDGLRISVGDEAQTDALLAILANL